MGLPCGAKICKYLLFIINILFWIAGIILLAIGLWALLDSKFTDTIVDWSNKVDERTDLTDDQKEFFSATVSYVKTGAIIIIVVGAISFLIGFLGCCGALKESKVLLAVYALLIFIILVILIASGIYVLIKKDSGLDEAQTYLEKYVLEEDQLKLNQALTNGTTSEDLKNINTIILPVMQQYDGLKCCGSKDWKNYKKNGTTVLCPRLKDSKEYNLCPHVDCSATGESGCAKAANMFVKDHLGPIGIVAACLGVFMVLVIVMALCLCSSIGKDEFA